MKGGPRPGSGRPIGSGYFKMPTRPARLPLEFFEEWYNGMARYWRELLAYYREHLKDKPRNESEERGETN